MKPRAKSPAPQPLWQISLTVAREAEDAAAVLLERLFGVRAAVYAPDEGCESVATVYFHGAAGQLRRQRATLAAELRALGHCGLRLGTPQIVLRKVRREDWTTSWKKYFKTIEVGAALLIKPSWSQRRPRPGQAAVTLDPGLSFGTGQHPTTAFCLEQLVQARRSGQRQSFLDIGTGSGILAIAAAKLGYDPVRALDNDPTAVRVARSNARRNRVAQRLVIVRQDLVRLPLAARDRHSVVCANLVQDLLLSQRERILARLEPGGRLVLAGLLTRQFAPVKEAYQQAGLRMEKSRTEREWTSGAFVRAW